MTTNPEDPTAPTREPTPLPDGNPDGSQPEEPNDPENPEPDFPVKTPPLPRS